MAKYTGKTVSVNRSAHEISEKFADLSQFSALAEQIPAEERQRVGDISFGTDSVTIHTPQVGDFSFRVTERTDSRVLMTGEGTPIPLTLEISLNATAADTTDITTAIDVEIPMMLKAFVGPQLQKAVDQMSGFITRLAQ